MAENF